MQILSMFIMRFDYNSSLGKQIGTLPPSPSRKIALNSWIENIW